MHTHRSTPAFSNSGKPCPTLADPSPPSHPFERIRFAIEGVARAFSKNRDAIFFEHKPLHLPRQPATPFQPEDLESARARLHSLMDGCPVTFSESAPPTPKIYTDLMIDIEALADLPDSAPAQIAIVFFNRDDPKTQLLTYNYTPSPISAIRLGFKVTTDTLKWWDDQGMTIDVQDGEPFEEVLDEIAHDISTHGTKGMRIWSRGNSYDLSILKLGYARIAKPLPWDFWMERDVRTWLEGTGFKSPRKNDHDARTDARNQALDIIESSQTIP